MENNRSRIVIIAIILATFAAGALVWYLAKPSANETIDVAQEEQLPQDGIFTPPQDQEIIDVTTPAPVAQERQLAPEPQVAAAVTPSAESGTPEIVMTFIALGIFGGAIGLYRFTIA
ncbi:MAG: hypothetical protein WEC84_04765 [Candidatus Andersenbacteria bacterium]